MSSHPLHVEITEASPRDGGPSSLRLVGFPDTVSRTWRADLAVEVRTYEGAMAFPLARGTDAEHHIVGAVYDRNGRLVIDTERAKSNRAWAGNHSRCRGDDGGATRVAGRTFFAGHLRHSFGHLLLEVVPRFWPKIDYSAYDQLAFYPTRVVRRPKDLQLEPYAREQLEALGADPSRAIVVSGGPLVFDELTVSTAAFFLQHSFSPRVTAPFDLIAERFAATRPHEHGPTPRRVYLSRSRLTSGRRAQNEHSIEALARSAGFDVLHPQELPIAAQVAAAQGAEVIAGCDGSALHLAAFARPGTKLLAIDSRAVLNQFMIDEARQLDAVHVLAAVEALHDRSEEWVADLALVRLGLEVLDLST